MLKLPSQLTPYARPDDDETTTAARGLEAHFLKSLLADVANSSEGGMLDGGFAGSTFREMLNGALADSMAKAGGIGLTKMLTKEMSKYDKDGGSGDGKSAGGAKSSSPVDIKPLHENHTVPLNNGMASFPGLHDTSKEPSSAPHLASPLDESTVVTSKFGGRSDPLEGDPRVHAGVDLRAATGTPAHAAQDGVVVRAEAAGNYGNLVVVDHGNGLQTRYAHLSHIDVKPGDHVTEGQTVGEVGATGRVTGPHLHFEVRQNGRAIDPTSALAGYKK